MTKERNIYRKFTESHTGGNMEESLMELEGVLTELFLENNIMTLATTVRPKQARCGINFLFLRGEIYSKLQEFRFKDKRVANPVETIYKRREFASFRDLRDQKAIPQKFFDLNKPDLSQKEIEQEISLDNYQWLLEEFRRGWEDFDEDTSLTIIEYIIDC